MKRVFFLDFDGTITKRDTCFLMVETFAGEGWKEIDEQWVRKEISTEECASLTFKLFQADRDDVIKLIETVEIDESFPDFLQFCRKEGHAVYILSDGYDVIIETLFKKYGIEVPYYANRMIYQDGFQIACPYLNPDCGQCGTCKSSLMEKLKGDAEQVIYIGDGASDTCPASKADLVFAKDYLYQYCLEKGIPVVRFETFQDIIEQIKE
ncbi:MAG TPA: MtnX-like HAD-IB family phosphatase [Syntrophomonadaceae bacterium]|nr:MtnX-like HAD-IB family phosphatase [Syntrophomonadaceae bacterium]